MRLSKDLFARGKYEKNMMYIIIALMALTILFWLHMRFACTGVYEKVRMKYRNEQNQMVERVECRYVGWKNFKFELFKKWFDKNSLK